MNPTTQIQTAQPMPPISRVVFTMANMLLKWEVRRKTRRKLAMIDDRLLKDIGISAETARTEAEKPFWRG